MDEGYVSRLHCSFTPANTSFLIQLMATVCCFPFGQRFLIDHYKEPIFTVPVFMVDMDE
jgi:hypothetical protein